MGESQTDPLMSDTFATAVDEFVAAALGDSPRQLWAVNCGSWERVYRSEGAAHWAAETEARHRHDGAAAWQLVRRIDDAEALNLWRAGAVKFDD